MKNYAKSIRIIMACYNSLFVRKLIYQMDCLYNCTCWLIKIIHMYISIAVHVYNIQNERKINKLMIRLSTTYKFKWKLCLINDGKEPLYNVPDFRCDMKKIIKSM